MRVRSGQGWSCGLRSDVYLRGFEQPVNLNLIIGLSCLGVVLLIVAVFLGVCCSRRKGIAATKPKKVQIE